MGRAAKTRVPRRCSVLLCSETTRKRLLRKLELARQRQVSSRNGITGLKQNVWQFRSLWTDLLKPGVKQQRRHIYHACTRVYKWPPDANFASISIVHWCIWYDSLWSSVVPQALDLHIINRPSLHGGKIPNFIDVVSNLISHWLL